MLTTRPASRYITVAIGALFFLAFYNFSGSSNSFNYHIPGVHLAHNDIKVAIIESKGCHDEVSASYLSVFGQLSECNTDVFLAAKRFGIETIFDLIPGAKKRNLITAEDFRPKYFQGEPVADPDIVLSVTSEYDLIDGKLKSTFEYLLQNTSSILFATVHHGDEWKDNNRFLAVKPWIQSNRLRFITLSDHVTDYMTANILPKWTKELEGQQAPISTFPPVFSIPTLSSYNDPALRFAMQGDLVVDRRPNRDYEGTFKRFAKVDSAREAIELHVVGDGGLPKVPEEAKDKIKFHQALPYTEFYEVLHSATALLPAFASHEYVESKASSTIPASLIAGSPLIADDDLLNAYRFLTKEDVYYREKGEDEIDVVERIAKLPEREREEKARKLRKKNEQLTKQGAELFRRWISESRERLST